MAQVSTDATKKIAKFKAKTIDGSDTNVDAEDRQKSSKLKRHITD